MHKTLNDQTTCAVDLDNDQQDSAQVAALAESQVHPESAMPSRPDYYASSVPVRQALARPAVSRNSQGPSCSCPSGDGSLRWPCPAHPPAAAEQSSPSSVPIAPMFLASAAYCIEHRGAIPPTTRQKMIAKLLDLSQKLQAARHANVSELAFTNDGREPDWSLYATAEQAERDALEPVPGDLLPPVGSKVLIHLARQDAWVEHTVTGYYVWGALSHQVRDGEKNAHRVFVRVKDAHGYDNARLLSEVRSVAAMSQSETQEDA